MGRVEGASFDPEAEKNASVTAAKTSRNLSGSKGADAEPGAAPAAAPDVSAARPHARASGTTQGSTPTSSSGRKYHHGSTRWCTVVRKRAKCSWTKKNPGKAGLRSDTTTNHGAATPAKSGRPAARWSRRQVSESRSMSV